MRPLKIVVGADHAGAELKDFLAKKIESLGHSVEDTGVAPGTEKADYPRITEKAVRLLLDGGRDFAVLGCGTGIGMSMAANRQGGEGGHGGERVLRQVLPHPQQRERARPGGENYWPGAGRVHCGGFFGGGVRRRPPPGPAGPH